MFGALRVSGFSDLGHGVQGVWGLGHGVEGFQVRGFENFGFFGFRAWG